LVQKALRSRSAILLAMPATPAPPVKVADSLSFLLNKLAQLAGRRMAEALAPLGMQPRESGILAAIAQFGAMSQQRIGEILLIDRTTMVMSVDRLEELGLVERVRQPSDRRVFLVELTDKGRAAVPQAQRLLEAFEADLLAPLSAQEQKRFRGALYKIVRETLTPDARSISRTSASTPRARRARP
jgi:DNA-binding MarR family transcriptional regulator